jgi:plastocyanin
MNTSSLRGALRLALAVVACALAAPAHAEGGTVKGKVEATPPKYLEDTVVYLKEVPGTYPKKTHPYDQKGMRFLPHVMTITVGDTVDFLNNDNLVHNVYSSDGEGYNLGSFKQGEKRTYTFEKQGVYGQLCSIHPEMQGFIFVGQNPYASAVDKKGLFEIKDVPPGSYKLAVWNSHLKAADKPVTVAAGKAVEESFSLKR